MIEGVRYHIINPSLCGPLRSYCGIRRPAPCTSTRNLATRPELLVCRECFGEMAREFAQLELFPAASS